jgi:hypothetical protein
LPRSKRVTSIKAWKNDETERYYSGRVNWAIIRFWKIIEGTKVKIRAKTKKRLGNNIVTWIIIWVRKQAIEVRNIPNENSNIKFKEFDFINLVWDASYIRAWGNNECRTWKIWNAWKSTKKQAQIKWE